LFLNNYHGLVQRAGAAVAFVPVGVIAHLLRRGSRHERGTATVRTVTAVTNGG
jgi:hypothetical protein